MSEEDSNLPFDPAASEAFNRHSERCLDGKITHKGDHPVACGGYADIYHGEVADRGLVAVKVMRPWSSAGRPVQRAKLAKRLWREYLAWSSLSHPNIIELLGFSYEFSPEWFVFPSLVSPWMSKGTVDSYIEDNHLADRLHLLVGIAKGLYYLHTRDPPIIHGDLRAGNVLVSDSGDPYLCDFGLSRVLGESRTATSTDPAGSLRWMSPELLHGDSGVNQYSDIWAYGMTILEVFTGDRPYSTLRNDGYVISQIIDGLTPLRPTIPTTADTLNNDVWSMCRQCWVFEPTKRPVMKEIISKLSELSVHDDVKSHSESLHSRPGTPSRGQSLPPISSLGGENLVNATGIAFTKQDQGSGTKLSSSKRRSPQKSGRRESPVSGTLADLASLVGIPQLENPVRTLMRCYDALEDVKVCRNLCRQLHRECVALLLDIKEIPAGISNMDYQRTVEEAEILVTNVSSIVQELSTQGRIKSIFYRHKIKKALKELHGDGFKPTRHDLIILTAPQESPEPMPISLHESLFSVPTSPWRRTRELLRSVLEPVASVLKMTSSMLTFRPSVRVLGPETQLDVRYESIRPFGPMDRMGEPTGPHVVSEAFDISYHRYASPELDAFPRHDEHCLDGRITDFNSQSLVLGGYANICQGYVGEQKVVIKSVRPFSHPAPFLVKRRILLRLWRQYEASHSASHPNVLPCLGFSYDFSPESFIYPSLIMPWMSNGTLSSYLDNHPEVDIHKLLLGVARGLSYLHDMQPPIVHGDVRAENILVSDSGVPCLSGLRLSENFRSEGVHTAPEIFGSLRWMSWELLRYDVKPDWNSDVWAYGMTILEITSRNPPYQELRGTAAVLRAIRGQILPSRPDSTILTDDLWEICLECWNFDPSQRRTMKDLLPKLESTAIPESA